VEELGHDYDWPADYDRYGRLPISTNRLSDASDSDLEAQEICRINQGQVVLKEHHPHGTKTASRTALIRRRQAVKRQAKHTLGNQYDPDLAKIYYPAYVMAEFKPRNKVSSPISNSS